MPLTMKVDRQPEKPSTMPASKTTRRRRAHSRRYRLHCPALSPGRRYDLPEASVRASAPRQGRPRSESAARARPRSRPPRRRQDWRWRSAESCQQKSSGRRACPWHSPIPERTRRTRRNRSADPPRLARVQSPAAIDRRYHCSEGGERHQVGHQTERQKRRRLASRAKAKPSKRIAESSTALYAAAGILPSSCSIRTAGLPSGRTGASPPAGSRFFPG
jgi:hypothetical protein